MAGTSYTRQSTLTDGDTITSALFNAEYNQLVTAFSYASTGTTGHQHDGGAGEGGNIEIIGDQDFLNKIVVDSTNNRWGVFVEVGGSAVEQIRIQDGAIVPVTDSDIDLGTSSLEFKDGYFDGTIHVDTLDVDANATIAGTLGVTGNTTVGGTLGITGNTTVGGTLVVTGTTTLNGGTLTLGDAASDNVVFGADVNSNIIPNTDSAFDLGSSSQEWRDLYLDGTAHIDTLDVDVNATIAGTLGVTGVLTGTSLDISGDIDVDGTTNLDVVDIDGAVDMATTLAVAGNVDFNGDLDVDGTTNLDVVDIDGAVDIATTLTVGGNVDFNGDLDVDGTIEFDAISGTGSVTVTDILDQDNMSGNSATALATQQSIKAYVDAQQDTVDTLAEILALSNTSSGTNVELTTTDKVQFRDSAIYINSSADGQLDIVADTEIQIAATTVDINGAINASGEIIAASLDISGAIDVAGTTNLDVVDIDGAVDMASTLTVAGDANFDSGTLFVDVSANSVGIGNGTTAPSATLDVRRPDASGKIAEFHTSTGFGLELGSSQAQAYIEAGSSQTLLITVPSDMTIDSGGDIILDADGEDIRFKDGGVQTFVFTMGAGSTISTPRGNLSLDVAGDIILDADGGQISLANGGTTNVTFNVDATPEVLLTGGNSFIGTTTSDADLTIFGSDGGSNINALVFDMSAAGAATFNAGITATSLDISGNIDVDGTTNLDVVDIDGAVDMATTLAVGGSVTVGSGNSSVKLSTWDASASDLSGILASSDFGGLIEGGENGNLVVGIRGNDATDGFSIVSGSGNYMSDTTYDKVVLKARADGLVTIGGNLDVDGTTNLDVVDIDGAVDMASTLAVGGVVTANAGVTSSGTGTFGVLAVDTMTLNASSITGTSNLTLDVAGDIILDADGSTITFKDGGTTRFNFNLDATPDFVMSGGNASITAASLNASFTIIGNDGGNDINALSFDMSAAGAATFNSSVNAGAGLRISTDGSNNGVIQTLGQNKDMFFSGDDGGSGINALVLDMSAAGAATFNSTARATRIGIGMNPTEMLDITSSSGDARIRLDAPSGSDTEVKFFNAGVAQYTIGHDDATDNFVIGTTNVDNDLVSINKSGAATFSASLAVTGALNTNTITINGASSGNEGGEIVFAGAGSNEAFNVDNFAGIFRIFDGSSPAVRLTLDTAGNAVFAGSVTATSLSTPTAGTSNVRFGVNAGNSIASGGNFNVVVGDEAGTALTTGDGNVAVGFEALQTEDTTSANTAIGHQALKRLNAGATGYNTAVGFTAGIAVTTGIKNTLIGGLAGDAITDADFNVALGYNALSTNQLGSSSVAIGSNALATQNPSSAASMLNVAVGQDAGTAVTTGANNTFVGALCGDGTQGGGDNTAVGFSALSGVCGAENVAVGKNALLISTAGRNTAIGWGAGDSNTTGGDNVYIGYDCAAYENNSTTGTANTYIGAFARGSSATVSSELAIGRFVLGQGASTATLGLNGNGATISIDGSDTSWAAHSDQRLKENITTSTAGLSFVNDLRPVTYTWKAKNSISEDFTHYYDADSTDPVNGVAGKTYHGFIAQEMKATIDAHSEVENGNNLWAERVDDIQQLAPSNLVPMLTKAIQELSAQVDALTARITTLEG